MAVGRLHAPHLEEIQMTVHELWDFLYTYHDFVLDVP